MRLEEREPSMSDYDLTLDRPTERNEPVADLQTTTSTPYQGSDRIRAAASAACGNRKGAIVASVITGLLTIVVVVLEVLRRERV